MAPLVPVPRLPLLKMLTGKKTGCFQKLLVSILCSKYGSKEDFAKICEKMLIAERFRRELSSCTPVLPIAVKIRPRPVFRSENGILGVFQSEAAK